MQDSLEDFLKIAGVSKDLNKKCNISKEALATIEHNKKCENYAQKIVEFLIDGKLYPQIFLRSLNFINQDYYDDVVEERAISNACGYAICGKKLPKMPKKQFHISTKQNKVYDISERKSFCSNYCYQASCFIKNQIDTSPLGLRKPENFPKFTLFNKTQSLSPGVEINQIPNNIEESNFTSVNSFTEACLDEAEQMENFPLFEEFDSKEKPKSILKKHPSTQRDLKTLTTISETEPEINEEDSDVILNYINNENNFQEVNDTIKELAPKKSVSFACEENQNNLKSSSETSSTLFLCKEEEIDDLNQYIEKIRLTMNLNINISDDKNNSKSSKEFEDRDKPIKIDLMKMQNVIDKVNKTNKQRQPILIETKTNPESHLTNPQTTAKCTSKKLNVAAENLNLTNAQVADDEKLKHIIEKVKNLELSKKSDCNNAQNEDRMKQVLQKLKSKNRKIKGTIIINTIENPEVPKVKTKPEITPQKNLQSKRIELNADLETMKTTLSKWLTLETYIFLHGEAKIKNILSKDILDKYYYSLKVDELQTTQQIRYLNICKKLQLKELAEEKIDQALLGKELKQPIPDYHKLREESKTMNLKVKAFYTGTLYEKENTNFPQKNNVDNETTSEEHPVVLPLVDGASQNAHRKKIFINSVTKYLHNHVHELCLEENVIADVQSMIKTFKLEANNIVFKPPIWNLISFVLIFILGLKDACLQKCLESSEGFAYRNLIFTKYSNAEYFLSEINVLVNDVNIYVEKYIMVE